MAMSTGKVPLPDNQSMAGQPPPQSQQHPGQLPGPQYPGQQYPGQQYPGQQYPGQQQQTIYIQSLPTHPHIYDQYNGKLSIIFGACLIVMTTVGIILNAAGMVIQSGRNYDWIGNLVFFFFPSAWCGLLVSIAS
jgi:hypothetical protein